MAFYFGPELAWQKKALCGQESKGEGKDVRQLSRDFFPEGGNPRAAAKLRCQDCPVVKECLQWALDHDEHGLWGGTYDKDRKVLRAGVAA